MNGWYNSDSWMDIVDHLLLVLGVLSVAVATAGVPVWISNHKATKTERARNTKTLEAIRHQVENDHGDDENMRDQIDRIEARQNDLAQLFESLGIILKEIKDRQDDHGRDIRGMRDDMGGLRGEDRDIKKDHSDLVRRINAFIRREHPGADPL